MSTIAYQCPSCGAEHTMEVRDKSVIACSACGYSQTMDELGFFHCEDSTREVRYVSDWSKRIYRNMEQTLEAEPDMELQADVTFRMVDEKKHKMVDVGEGVILLKRGRITLRGRIHGEETDLQVPIAAIPALPFSPGKHLEVQHGETIYRCVFRDGRPVMKFINMVKAQYCMEQANLVKVK